MPCIAAKASQNVQVKESLFLRTESIVTCVVGKILSVFFPGHLLAIRCLTHSACVCLVVWLALL
jgi:hypothetical protein